MDVLKVQLAMNNAATNDRAESADYPGVIRKNDQCGIDHDCSA